MKKIIATIISLTCAFSLFVTPVHADYYENQTNDTKLTAESFQLGETVYGTVDNVSGSNDCNDWYKFKAPVSGTVKITAYADSPCTGAKITAHPADSTSELGAMEVNESEFVKSFTFRVVSGNTYYIKAYTGYLGRYGNYHFKTSYVVDKTSIRSLTAKDNAFKVQWSKKDTASFYQVQYTPKTTYANYAWTKAKVKKVGKSYKYTTVSKLSNKRTYYVRVRVGRTVNGKTYYSSWSSKMKVTTK